MVVHREGRVLQLEHPLDPLPRLLACAIDEIFYDSCDVVRERSTEPPKALVYKHLHFFERGCVDSIEAFERILIPVPEYILDERHFRDERYVVGQLPRQGSMWTPLKACRMPPALRTFQYEPSHPGGTWPQSLESLSWYWPRRDLHGSRCRCPHRCRC